MTQISNKRKKFLHDVFTTALEGGIGYWSVTTVYHLWENPKAHWSQLKEDIDGFYAVIEPSEEEWGVQRAFQPSRGLKDEISIGDHEPLTINQAVIDSGIARFVEWIDGSKRNGMGSPVLPNSDKEYLNKPAKPGNEYWEQFLAANETNGEYGDYDADVADAIVQLGLFNEVVYG